MAALVAAFACGDATSDEAARPGKRTPPSDLAELLPEDREPFEFLAADAPRSALFQGLESLMTPEEARAVLGNPEWNILIDRSFPERGVCPPRHTLRVQLDLELEPGPTPTELLFENRRLQAVTLLPNPKRLGVYVRWFRDNGTPVGTIEQPGKIGEHGVSWLLHRVVKDAQFTLADRRLLQESHRLAGRCRRQRNADDAKILASPGGDSR